MREIRSRALGLIFALLIFTAGIMGVNQWLKSKEIQGMSHAVTAASLQLSEILKAQLASGSLSSANLFRKTNRALLEIDRISFHLRSNLSPRAAKEHQQSLIFLVEIRSLISEMHLLSLHLDRADRLSGTSLDEKADTAFNDPNLTRTVVMQKERLSNDLLLEQDKANNSMELIGRKALVVQNLTPYIAAHFGDGVVPASALLQQIIIKMKRQ